MRVTVRSARYANGSRISIPSVSASDSATPTVIHCDTMTRSARQTAIGAASVQRSFRLSADTMRLLDERADELSESRNSLTQRLLDEGLHTDRHPLVYFREGGAGQRRPALVGTRLYVWQVLDTVRASEGSVSNAAEYLGLSERQVQAAIDYCAEFAEEVGAQREQELRVQRRERERFERAQRVLG
jgi:uncharacterized protein (DUF433 family)